MQQALAYGFTADDLSVLDVPPYLHPECYAKPTSESTFAIQDSKREGAYETRHNGVTACGCSCLGGIHERLCWHQKRLNYHLKRRAARLAAQQNVVQEPLIQAPLIQAPLIQAPRDLPRDIAPLHSAVRGFNIMRH